MFIASSKNNAKDIVLGKEVKACTHSATFGICVCDCPFATFLNYEDNYLHFFAEIYISRRCVTLSGALILKLVPSSLTHTKHELRIKTKNKLANAKNEASDIIDAIEWTQPTQIVYPNRIPHYNGNYIFLWYCAERSMMEFN